eukprot:TRINITY_DN10827_c0_g2_i3.p1 TRINITY_DN10827_c0_g2~~TRINITY_DN10827_c0_g2_i3.p1  ORF type:complete len:221 (-),score=17.47 TRINITY_DN10827_c0_g2_i3:58-642(-)
MDILHAIETDSLLPPLLVLQILAQKSNATLNVVKDYIVRKLQKEGELIKEDKAEIARIKKKTEDMRVQIEELKTKARIFQISKCSACTSPLEPPVVHFLCMHSFHQHCLYDNDASECPLCSPENKKILDIKARLEEGAGEHDKFFKLLGDSHDGFDTVSEYFGRGIFNNPLDKLRSVKKPIIPSGDDARDSLLS